MSDYGMADIAGLLAASNTTAINSTSRKNNTDLDMTDFLQLMIVQLQSQTLDNSMDTSEMMNQMVQMQMVTAITNMTETNIMSYATSLSYSDWYLLTFMPYGYMDSVVSHFSQEWGILTILRPSSSLVPCCWCSTSITPMPAGNSMMWRRFGLWRRQPG